MSLTAATIDTGAEALAKMVMNDRCALNIARGPLNRLYSRPADRQMDLMEHDSGLSEPVGTAACLGHTAYRRGGSYPQQIGCG